MRRHKRTVEDDLNDVRRTADSISNKLADMLHDANWIMDEANKLKAIEFLPQEVKNSLHEISQSASELAQAML